MVELADVSFERRLFIVRITSLRNSAELAELSDRICTFGCFVGADAFFFADDGARSVLCAAAVDRVDTMILVVTLRNYMKTFRGTRAQDPGP